jgi:hypothetical protein
MAAFTQIMSDNHNYCSQVFLYNIIHMHSSLGLNLFLFSTFSMSMDEMKAYTVDHCKNRDKHVSNLWSRLRNHQSGSCKTSLS